jgi:hypothetical protein
MSVFITLHRWVLLPLSHTHTHTHTHTQQRKTIRDDHVLFKWEESTQPDNITQLLAQVRVRVCVGLDIHI